MWVALTAVAFCQGPLEAVQEAIKKTGAVEFAYEGESERLGEFDKPSKHPAISRFSGSLTIKPETRLVTLGRLHDSLNGPITSKASFSPTKSSATSWLEGRKEPLNQSGWPGGYLGTRAVESGNLWVWFPSAALLVANEDDDKHFVDRGEEVKDGRRCRLIVHTYVSMETKYWVDLERNGVVIAIEGRTKGVLGGAVTAKEMREFMADGGLKVWLPTTVVDERFVAAKRPMRNIPVGQPGHRFTYRILPESVKIDGKPAKS
jgi:hypothetical protein